MTKLISIPRQIVECLSYFSSADRGEAYQAILIYIDTQELPNDDISPAARGAFEFARRIIDPILERRKRAAERRLARKKAMESCINSTDSSPLNEVEDTTPPDPQKAVPRKVKINSEHIYTMRSVVNMAYRRNYESEEKRDADIRNELNRRFPGIYSDITYDKSGFIKLHPAS